MTTRFIRYFLYFIAGLVALVAAAVTVTLLLLDEDDYKRQIERLAQQHTNLELNLAGDLKISLFPLGLELSEVEARLEDQPFVNVERLVARMGLWSLLRRSPEVHAFVLTGLEARLRQDVDGSGNWERVLPEQDQPTPAEAAEEVAEEPAASGPPISFNVREIRIDNASVHYQDDASGESLQLDDFELLARNIQLDRAFPLQVRFNFAHNPPELNLHVDLSATLTASESLQQFIIEDLDSRVTLSGDLLNGQRHTATLTGNIRADLEQETAQLSALQLGLAGMAISSELTIRGFETPQLQGKLRVAEFSPRRLLRELGQPDIETSDPKVLGKLSLSTDIGGPPGEVQLSPLSLVLDDTRINGSIAYRLEDGRITANLKGDSIDADRYLPPEEEDAAETAAAEPEEDLLPLEALREMLWSLRFGMDSIRVAGLSLSDFQLQSTAANGVIAIDPLAVKLYQGGLQANVRIDASQANPLWHIRGDLSGVRLLPLLRDLAEVELISGASNIKMDINTRGNRISALKQGLDGRVDLNIAEGAIEGSNFAEMACRGVAMVHQEQMGEHEWPPRTPFENLSATFLLKGPIVSNDNLDARLRGLGLEGKGSVNIDEMAMDYRAGLRVLGAFHDDRACRVNDRVRDLIIPVRCRGSLTDAGPGLCGFDASRFADTLRRIIGAEAQQRAQEELDRQKERLAPKVEEQRERLREQEDKARDRLRQLIR